MFPGLAGFYKSSREVGYTLVRIIIGYILLMHGWVKMDVGVVGTAADMAKYGLEPSLWFAYAATFFESVGGICIILGLFTRFFAPALAIELWIAFYVAKLPHGFAASKGGFEYVLLLGIVMFAIALRGGGLYSVDRVIGTEL